MIWLAFVGVIGLCAATTVAITAARRTTSASHAPPDNLAPAGVYPEADGVGPAVLLVAGVGAAIISVALTVYSLRHLDSSGAPPNLLGQPALSGVAQSSNAHTGPLKLPRRASIGEVARD